MRSLQRFVFLLTMLCPSFIIAQSVAVSKGFTHADTVRGGITPERTWWDVLRYDITVKPDYLQKSITGSNIISYKVIADSYPAFMQIDLQEPLIIDSVVFGASRKLPFTKEGNAWHVQVPKQRKLSETKVAGLK